MGGIREVRTDEQGIINLEVYLKVAGEKTVISVKSILKPRLQFFILLQKVSDIKRIYDLEERLINFASDCIDVAENLPKTFAGNHIASQLVRSSTSPAIHYDEAQAAESPNDFIHKM